MPAIIAFGWMAGRYTEVVDGKWFTTAVAKISEDRAESLNYRIYAETLLLERARERPVLGWGAWGRSRVKDDDGRDRVAVDGLWIIFLGTNGLVGLLSFYLWWCWPSNQKQ